MKNPPGSSEMVFYDVETTIPPTDMIEFGAIEDIRMNIEILKNCCLTIFLEEHVGFASETKPVRETKILGEVINQLNDAMKDKRDIWMSYNGGTNPLVPRQVRPIEWVHEQRMFKAWCHQSRFEKHFAQRKIMEIRGKNWEL